MATCTTEEVSGQSIQAVILILKLSQNESVRRHVALMVSHKSLPALRQAQGPRSIDLHANIDLNPYHTLNIPLRPIMHRRDRKNLVQQFLSLPRTRIQRRQCEFSAVEIMM